MKRLLPLWVILILALTAGALAASRDGALAIARKQAPEAAQLTELELEPTDGGRYVYDGEARAAGREFSFEINAANGKFIEWGSTTDLPIEEFLHNQNRIHPVDTVFLFGDEKVARPAALPLAEALLL